MKAPFIPRVGDNFDKSYCEQKDKPGMETRERYEKYYAEGTVVNAFKEFFYFIDADIERQESPKKSEQVNSLKKSQSDGDFKLPVIKKNRVMSSDLRGVSVKEKHPSLFSSNSTNIISTIRKTNKSGSEKNDAIKPFK